MPADQVDKKQQPVHVITNAHQHKEITSSDRTEIKFNSNSELWLSPTYGQPKREVTLEGEAYFEFTHNPAKPFVIHTRSILIKDLETAFNMRAIPGKKNIQVAVKSGKVSILYEEDLATEEDLIMKETNLSRPICACRPKNNINIDK